MIPALERWTGDHAMTKDTTKASAVGADIMLFDNWFDAIEDGVRARVRGFIGTMLEEELDEALSRPRYGRRKARDNNGPASSARMARRASGRANRFAPTNAAPKPPTL